MTLTHLLKDPAYFAYESQLEREVRSGELPKHMAIIMDGNRRYAREVLNAPTSEGHRLGKEKLDEVVHWCLKVGVRNLTVFAFSTENFNREPEEVSYIMELLEQSLYELGDDKDVHEYHVGVNVIGERNLLPENVIKAAEYAEERTKDYTDYTLNMAIAYGGRQDIINAVKKVAEKVKNGEMSIDDITEDSITECISTSETPDPDLILRTSGEIRLSNFLLWQMAYSELYFTDVYWPGFRYIDFLRAIRTFQYRKRRYGA